jgi:hypothetical protein
MVFNILKNNCSLIENDAIQFVFSSSIEDINKDYKSYIERKITEYKENPNSDLDVKSLTQQHMTDKYYQKVIELLSKNKCLLCRGEHGNKTFTKLIKKDLNEAELIIIDKDYLDNSEINQLNLTLYQLLKLQINNKGPIFPMGKIDEFINSWSKEARTEGSFLRHTITTEIRGMEPKKTKGNKDNTPQMRNRLATDIEYRLSILYSKMYCEDHFVLEFDPQKEWRLLYSRHFIRLFLRHIFGNEVPLDYQKVLTIRNSPEWGNFKEVFALSMCDFHIKTSFERTKAEEDILIKDYEFVINKLNLGERFSSLKSHIVGG